MAGREVGEFIEFSCLHKLKRYDKGMKFHVPLISWRGAPARGMQSAATRALSEAAHAGSIHKWGCAASKPVSVPATREVSIGLFCGAGRTRHGMPRRSEVPIPGS
jgi:hypothetical protein